MRSHLYYCVIGAKVLNSSHIEELGYHSRASVLVSVEKKMLVHHHLNWVQFSVLFHKFRTDFSLKCVKTSSVRHPGATLTQDSHQKRGPSSGRGTDGQKPQSSRPSLQHTGALGCLLQVKTCVSLVTFWLRRKCLSRHPAVTLLLGQKDREQPCLYLNTRGDGKHFWQFDAL